MLPADVEFDLAMQDGSPTEFPSDALFDLAMFDENAEHAPSESAETEFDFSMFTSSQDSATAQTPIAPIVEQQLCDKDQIIGERMDLDSNPAFRAAIESREASSHPTSIEVPQVFKKRSFDFTTGQVYGPAGAQTVITIRPQCLFRIEKVIATDSNGSPGTGTAIVQIAIGQKIQKPTNRGRGSLSVFFAWNSLADGVRLDTAQPWENIAITVSFVQSCTFSCTLFGTAEIE